MSSKKEIKIEGIMASDGDGMEASFIPIMSEGGHPNERIEIPDELPILPLRNMVIFPGVLIPISVGREKSLNAISTWRTPSLKICTITALLCRLSRYWKCPTTPPQSLFRASVGL